MAGVYYIENDRNLFFDDADAYRLGGLDPTRRIGLKIIKAVVEDPGIAIEIDEGTRIGKTTIFGEYQDISYVQGYIQGKNIKNMNMFYRMNVPLIRANNCQYYKNQRLTGEIDHKLSLTRDIALGQNDQLRKQQSQGPFNDLLGRDFSPVDYVRAGKYILAYPIVTDNTTDFFHYNDPDAVDSAYGGGHFRDAILEPLSIRNSFANANTNFANIMIEGCKGNIMPYHQEQGDFSDKKGSCLIDNKIEIRQGAYDWYEDAQDIAMNLSGSAFEMTPFDFSSDRTSNTLSKEGYVSDGIYVASPFVDEDVDKKYFKNQYRQLASTPGVIDALLASSSFTLSTIGTRFKSNQNGFIIAPKYDNVVQTVLGVDSIAFSGLLRN